MSIFGWSYPPGCNGPPDDDETSPEMQDGLDTLCDFLSVNRLNSQHTNYREVESRLSRHVYKYTDCGAQIKLDWENNQLLLWSIVEGSDAEVSADPIPFDKITGDAIQKAIDYIEDECDVLWHEANDDNKGIEL